MVLSILAGLPAISSFWTLFVGIYTTEKVMHWCSMKAIQPLLFKDSWVLQIVT